MIGLKKLFSTNTHQVKGATASPYAPGRPTEHRLSKPEKNRPPKSPGEYRIMDKDRRIKYIGETCDLNRREHEHRHTGKLKEDDIFAWQPASDDSTSDSRRDHERKKIKQHNPPLNKSHGGEGRKVIDHEKAATANLFSRFFEGV